MLMRGVLIITATFQPAVLAEAEQSKAFSPPATYYSLLDVTEFDKKVFPDNF